MKIFGRIVLVILVALAGLAVTAHSQAVLYAARPADKVNRVPCPAGVVPTSLTVTQKGQNKYPYLPTIPHRRIISGAQPALDHLYSVVCAIKLVHYSHVVVQNCPNAWSTFSDHLIFNRGKARILGLHVKLEGCETLSVDHRPNLGTAYPTGKFWSRLRAVIKTSQPPPAEDVTVTAPPAPIQPVKATLGRYLKLIIPARTTTNGPAPSWLVHADPKFLKLVSSGPGDASHFVYRWQAVTAGEAVIVLDPLCRPYGCMAPSLGIRVQINP